MAEQVSAFIRIAALTKLDLDELGHKGDTYETIVRRILDYYLEAHPNDRRPIDTPPLSP